MGRRYNKRYYLYHNKFRRATQRCVPGRNFRFDRYMNWLKDIKNRILRQ